MKDKALKILKNNYPDKIAKAVIESYTKIEENYKIKKWKPSELDGGHFVEAIRRIIEIELFNKTIPLNNKLNRFNDQELKRYMQSSGNESFRILIPRALRSIYNIRSRRGVGHITDISPNQMDASYILHTSKWVLAEILRINSNLSNKDRQKLVDNVTKREIEMIWANNGIKRVLKTSLKTKEEVLVLLYDESPLSDEKLIEAIEYSNPSVFKNNVLEKLHNKRLIDYQEDKANITPTGEVKAEKIINKKTIDL